MITVEVDKASLNKVLKDFKKYPPEKQKLIREEIRYALIRIRELAVKTLRSTLKKSSGQLERAIKYTMLQMGGEAFCSVKHGEYIEFGTVAHPIYPVRKQALAWGKTKGWKGDVPLKEFVAKRVFHPGTRAKPFMRPAARRGTRELVERIKKIL